MADPISLAVNVAINFAVSTVLSHFQTIRGPKLGDIARQTSQEGVPRPIIFGMSPPIAGNIIATSEPRKVTQSKRVGPLSGIGVGPKVKTEHVYRTYAIRVCEGPISAFVRIWRNGKLVFDARDNFDPLGLFRDFTLNKSLNADTAARKRVSAKMRLYLGTYDQMPDSALEGVFGVGTTPAHRGSAYMVMDDEELTDLGGAIPQWTFQVFNGPVQTDSYFTESGEWLKPAGLLSAEITVVGGGGGGGSGATGFYGNQSNGGGGGGGGGGVSIGTFTAGDLPDSVTVTVGSGGSGASAVTANTDTVGNAGSNGGSSSFGALLTAGGGLSGDGASIGFTPGPPGGGGVGGTGSTSQGNNAGQWNSNPANPVTRTAPGGGGGGGAFLNFPPQVTAGTAGGVPRPNTNNVTHSSGGASPGFGVNGNGGTPGMSPGLGMFGGGGGGGSGSRPHGDGSGNPATNGGDGGDGAAGSGGGGGGSGGYNGSGPTATSGKGGNGGIGFVRVRATFTDPGEFGTVSLADIVSQISARAGLDASKIDVSQLTQRVRGFMVTNSAPAYESLRALSQIFMFDPSSSDGKIKFINRGGNSVATITENDMIEDESEDDIEQEKREDPITIPRVLHLNYYDVDGGLNPDKQSSYRVGARRNNAEIVLQSPVLMDANEAAQALDKTHKVIIEDQKAELKFGLPDSFLKLAIADPIIVQWHGKSERTRITQLDVHDGYQDVTALRDRQSAYTSNVEGIPASPQTGVDLSIPGPTRLQVMDVPPLTSEDAEMVGVYVAISGILSAWQGATLELSLDGGANYIDAADRTMPTVMGETLTTLGDHPQAYPDTEHTVRVRIDTPDGELLGTDLAGLLNRVNYALIGDEIIQFADVDEVSPGVWDLSYFLRGRRHTATESHAIGSRFVLLDVSAMEFVQLDVTSIGRPITLRATSFGMLPEDGTVVTINFTGRSQIEFPVGYLQAHKDGDDAVISWQGAGRMGAGANVSQGTRFIGYQVTITDGVLTETVDTLAQTLTHDISAFSGPVTISVRARNQLTGVGPATEVILANP